MGKVTPINWALIKSDYIFGSIMKDGKVRKYSCADVARKHGCSQASVLNKSAKEGWNEIRKQYLKEVENEVMVKKKDKLVSKVLEFDESVFTIACYAIRILEDKLLVEKVYKDKKGREFKEKVVNLNAKTSEIIKIMQATKIAQDIRSNALGDIRVNASEDSINQLVDLIEAERLKASG